MNLYIHIRLGVYLALNVSLTDYKLSSREHCLLPPPHPGTRGLRVFPAVRGSEPGVQYRWTLSRKLRTPPPHARARTHTHRGWHRPSGLSWPRTRESEPRRGPVLGTEVLLRPRPVHLVRSRFRFFLFFSGLLCVLQPQCGRRTKGAGVQRRRSRTPAGNIKGNSPVPSPGPREVLKVEPGPVVLFLESVAMEKLFTSEKGGPSLSNRHAPRPIRLQHPARATTTSHVNKSASKKKRDKNKQQQEHFYTLILLMHEFWRQVQFLFKIELNK